MEGRIICVRFKSALTMAIDLYEGIMHHLNVLNVCMCQITMEFKISKCMQILVSYAWKSHFGIMFASIDTQMKWYL